METNSDREVYENGLFIGWVLNGRSCLKPKEIRGKPDWRIRFIADEKGLNVVWIVGSGWDVTHKGEMVLIGEKEYKSVEE